MHIDSVSAREIPDTRGKPTIETTITAGEFIATASVPSGKSTGSHEALELRERDGGVLTAIEHVEKEIAHALMARAVASADDVDELLIELDGTPDKSRLGANAILSVSIAAQRLDALEAGVPLWKAIANRAGTTPAAPRLYVNVMNGGVHVHPAGALAEGDRFPLPFQEYILVVEGLPSEALAITREAFTKLGERLATLLKLDFNEVPMGDEGGYAPTFSALDEPFELLDALVAEFPHTSIAIDAAASELYKDGAYHLIGKSYTPDDLAREYARLADQFPFHSIEDPFAEDAGTDFAKLTATIGNKVIVIGDDLTVTNPHRIKDAIDHKEINGVLIKPNQIGTVMEAIRAVKMTQQAGWAAVCSHRSGETDDTFIADFAYGCGAHGIKAGGLGQKERLEKYERLLEIEMEAKTV